MTATSVQVKLVLGHKAHFRDEPTEQGYTHDWTVYVCGPDGNKVQPFVEKVVFILHESFRNPKRVVKDPPYEIKESGYAGFLMHIDVYFKNKDEPRKLQFKYDLFLNSDSAPPVDHTRCETLTFQNPAEEFRRRLIKGGGVGVPCASDYNMHQVKTTPSPVKTSPVAKPLPEPDKEFASIFGAPIKTEQHKKKAHSSSKEKHRSKHDNNEGSSENTKEKTNLSKDKSSKRPLDEGSADHSEKKKKKRDDKHKESNIEKAEKSKSPKEKEVHLSSKHKSPKDKDACSSSRKSSHKNSKKTEKVEKSDKSHKNESKSSRHTSKLNDEVHIELQKVDTGNKVKKELQPFNEILSCSDGETSNGDQDTNIRTSSLTCSGIFEQMKGPYGTDEDSILSPLPERPDIFGTDSEGGSSPVKESSSKHKKKKSKKQKREKNLSPNGSKKDKKTKDSKDRKCWEDSKNTEEVEVQELKVEPKETEDTKFVPKMSLSPGSDESPLHEDPLDDPDDPEQADSQTDAYEEEGKEEPPSLEPRAPSGELISELRHIHLLIQNSCDPNMLQKVVDIIEDTGLYAVTDKTFDFDLCKLNSSTLVEIKNCIQAQHE